MGLPDMPATASVAIAWLFTYALHSTALLALAWLASAVLGARRPKLQELLWRCAFFGAVLTTTVQSAVVIRPLAGTIRLQQHNEAATPVFDEEAVLPPTSAGTLLPTAETISTPTNRQLAKPVGPRPSWEMVFILLWAAGAAFGLTRLGLALLRLRGLLGDRRPFPAGRMVRAFARIMGIARPVRVSTSQSITVPFAVGIRRPEICFPDRLLDDLPAPQLEGLVAHEIAHLARRDPAWLVIYGLMDKVFFFQPLNRLARRHLEDVAEVLADDRAVACTGNRRDLARCLVEVAQYSVETPSGLAVAAALSRPSTLRQRVERLLQPGSNEASGLAWAVPVVGVVLLVVALAAPGVSCSLASADEVRDIKSGRTSAADESAPEPPTPEAPPLAPSAEVELLEPAAPPAPAEAPESVAGTARPIPEAAPATLASPRAPAPPAPPGWMTELEAAELESMMLAIERRLDVTREELAHLRNHSESSAEQIERQVAERMQRDSERERAHREKALARAEEQRLEVRHQTEERREARRLAEQAAGERDRQRAEERQVRDTEARARDEERSAEARARSRQRAEERQVRDTEARARAEERSTEARERSRQGAEERRVRDTEARARAEERSAEARERSRQRAEDLRQDAELRARVHAEQRKAVLAAREHELLEFQQKLELLRKLIKETSRETPQEK